MNKKLCSTALLALLMLTGFNNRMYGQYPVVPDTTRTRGLAQDAEIKRLSDSAWQQALPVVLAEAEAGRPYVPWASRPEHLTKAAIPAFPGAVGPGAYTAGGRGGRVITVTNLNDSGEGSFRWACEQGGARIIVFNVSGVIHLKSPIHVRAPYLTIAGQSAPGDGVCIAGETFEIDTHDVIIRHMRFRRGSTDVYYRNDALGGNPVGNIILDHCSGSWGLDEVISIYRHMYNRDSTGIGTKMPTVNMTIQNSIFAEGLDTYNHAFGGTLGGNECLVVRNLFASNVGRNPSISSSAFNYINNVVFNYWNRTADGIGAYGRLNVINNYYKPGPITPKGKAIEHRVVKLETSTDNLKRMMNISQDEQVPAPDQPDRTPRRGHIYVEGNYVDGNPIVSRDNWEGGVQLSDSSATGPYTAMLRAKEPAPLPNFSERDIMTAEAAFRFVMEKVGATLPKRDAVDERIIKTVITGQAILAPDAEEFETPYVKRRLPADSYKSGIITHIQQVGGLPEYKGEPYLDSDMDGMPDAWEKANKLNPNDPSDAILDCNGDGYTNIEKYLNGIDTRKKIDWTKPGNNRDTLDGKSSLMDRASNNSNIVVIVLIAIMLALLLFRRKKARGYSYSCHKSPEQNK